MNEIQNIDVLTTEILILKNQTAQNIIEIGKRLVAVKDSLPHGEFGNYLKEKVAFSERTAQNFMKVAREFSNTKALADLEPTKVYALLDLPSEEHEEFVSASHEINGEIKTVDEMSTRELQKVIKEKVEALKQLDEARKHSDEKAQEVKKLFGEKCQAEAKARTVDGLFRDAQSECNSIQDILRQEREKSEKRLENLNKVISENRELLLQAQSSGNDEEVERLQSSLQETQKDLDASALRIDELEEQLKAKPVDVITATPEIIEKVPEEIEKELQELRAKSVQGSNTSVTEFKVYFKYLNETFEKELKAMADIKLSDPQIYEKCKSNILRLINNMEEKLV